MAKTIEKYSELTYEFLIFLNWLAEKDLEYMLCMRKQSEIAIQEHFTAFIGHVGVTLPRNIQGIGKYSPHYGTLIIQIHYIPQDGEKYKGYYRNPWENSEDKTITLLEWKEWIIGKMQNKDPEDED